MSIITICEELEEYQKSAEERRILLEALQSILEQAESSDAEGMDGIAITARAAIRKVEESA